MAGFSFTMISSHQAIVFGGKLARGINADYYIFDFATKVGASRICTSLVTPRALF